MRPSKSKDQPVKIEKILQPIVYVDYEIQVFDVENGIWGNIEFNGDTLDDAKDELVLVVSVEDSPCRIVEAKTTITSSDKIGKVVNRTYRQKGEVKNEDNIPDNYKITCLDCEATAYDPGIKMPTGWGFIQTDVGCFYGCSDHKDL